MRDADPAVLYASGSRGAAGRTFAGPGDFTAPVWVFGAGGNGFIDSISEIGVIVLMFTAGLDTNIKDLKKVGVSFHHCGRHRRGSAPAHGLGDCRHLWSGGKHPSACVYRRDPHSHQRQHYSGNPKGIGQVEHQGGQHHPGCSGDRRYFGHHCADRDLVDGGQQCQHLGDTVENSAVLCVCGGLCLFGVPSV